MNAIVDITHIENMDALPFDVDPEDVWIVDPIGASAHKGHDNTPEQLQVRVAYIREFIPEKHTCDCVAKLRR